MRRSSLLVCMALFDTCSFAKDYHAEQYDVTFRIERGGTAQVSETAVFQFQGGPFTFVYRDISAAKTDGIVNVRAYMDGRPCAEGTGPGEVTITGRSPVQVRWHFAPASDASHRFTVEYRVLGVARKLDSRDTVIWRAIPQQRRYRIRESTLRIEYPDGVQASSRPTLRGSGEFESEKGGAAITLADVSPKSDIVFTAGFPSGSLIGAPPQWEAAELEHRSQLLAGLRDGALLAFGLIAVGVLWLSRVREGFPRVDTPDGEQSQRPDELTPAHAAALTRQDGGAIGTMLDLAQRGVLRIEETEHHRWTSRHFVLRREAAPPGDARHDLELLSLVFPGGSTEVKMSDAIRRLRQHRRPFDKAVTEELISSGLLDPERNRKQRFVLIAAVSIVVVAVPLALAGVALDHNGDYRGVGMCFATAAGVFAMGIIGIIYAFQLQPWTDTGAVTAAQWRAFRNYLAGVARGKIRLPAPDEFERYLPYAAAFGIAQAWTKKFQREADLVLPSWFYAQGAPDDGMTAFIACMGSSDSSAAATGAGGAAGASGGGASGAG